IEADRVDVSQQGAQAVEAPAVAVRGQDIPVIDWIAPTLSLRAEVVWRHPGDHARPVPRVEKKQLRVSPHVARIRGDEERQVTDDAHSFGAGVALQARPLTKQQELTESNQVDLARPITPRPFERYRRAADEILGPLKIRGAAVLGLER